MKNYNAQLKSLITGAMIAAVGGFVYVASAGDTAKLSLTDKDGAALSNPLALTNGSFDFFVADTVAAVDLFIQSPTGHFLVVKSVKPSGDASLFVDDSLAHTTMVIPFDVADQAGDATETVAGFTIIGAVQPNVGLDIHTADAAITLDVGTLASASGDADAFIDGLSTATQGYIKATNANGAVTLGAKLIVQDSANAGDDFPEQDISQSGKQISWTLLTAADTASGYIMLPVVLPVSSL